MITTSNIILSGIVNSNEYSSKVFPHLKSEYFNGSDKIVFDIIKDFILKYSSLPSEPAILIELENKQINQKLYNESIETVKSIFKYDINNSELQWLLDTSERYCKDIALHLAINEAIEITDKTSGISETAIPDILTKALSVSFDSNIGEDYLENFEERYDRYTSTEDKVPFDLEIFNTIFNGGSSKGRQHIIMAGIAGGKSLSLCHLASSSLLLGQNTLYITLEISGDEVSQRIDANLLDIEMNKISSIGKNAYINSISNLKKKTLGKLIIYDSVGKIFNSILLKSVLEDLKLKKNFVPDIVFIDYLGICKSSIYKEGTTTSYIYFKSIAEELRSVCRQYHFSLWTAVQLNRGNFSNTDADMTGIADSFGIPMTADWTGVIINTDELTNLNQIEINQVKSRYTDLSKNKRFYLGIDKPKMRLYELSSKPSEIDFIEDFQEPITSNNTILDKLKKYQNLDFN